MESLDPRIKELEDRIRQLESDNKRLNQIIHNIPIPIFAINKSHEITHFNKALETLTGLSAADMVGSKHQWQAFYKNARPVMADLIIDQADQDKILHYYGEKSARPTKAHNTAHYAATDFFKDVGKKGRWLQFTAAALEDQDGAINGAVETLQDVTEEKTAEHQMQELYKLYHKILEFIPYPIIVYNRKGWVSFINRAFTRTFGWSFDEVKGSPIPFIPEDLEAETHSMINEYIEKKIIRRYETRRLTKDGRVLDVVIWGTAHAGKKKEDAQNFFILRNITEEKRLEANNRTIMRISAVLPEYPELEDLMNYISKEVRTLLNTEGALILLYDNIKEEFFFSGASYDDLETDRRARTYRFPVDAILAGQIIKTGEYALINDASKLAEKYPERDQLLGYKTRSILEVPIKNEDRIIGVLCAINKKQNLFDYQDMELLTMIAGTCAISIENARFSQAVRDACRDMASMNRAKSKAINHLSHELKTPVAVLLGSIEILRRKLLAGNIEAASTIRRVERNLQRVVDIQAEVADIMEEKTYAAHPVLITLLDVCRDELETLIHLNIGDDNLEAAIRKAIDNNFGPRELHFSRINIGDKVRHIFEALTPEFSFRDIDIRLSIDEQAITPVLPEEIPDKMISGIIKNAIENTPDLGRINIGVEGRKSGVLFMVQDYGVGIEAEHQARIFEGFLSTQDAMAYSTKKPFAFNAGGKGADLLRMKMFSDRHGFTLEMTSRRCTFLVSNPEDACPGNISDCQYCRSPEDCIKSGFTIFSVFFPLDKNLLETHQGQPIESETGTTNKKEDPRRSS